MLRWLISASVVTEREKKITQQGFDLMGFLNDEWKWRSSWIFWYALKHIRWCNGACHQLSCWCAKSVRCIDTIAIFIIDWPTISICITWINRIHFVSISCVFDVFRYFCKILHSLETKSNAIAFNWSGFFLFKCWKISRFNLNICWSLSPMNGAVSIFFIFRMKRRYHTLYS